MKNMLLAEAGRVAQEAAPSFQVVGKTHQTAAVPVLNTAQALPAGASAVPGASSSAASSGDAVANSILGSTMSGYFEILGYLLLVLGGVWLLLWLLRRGGVGMFSPERQVMAIESRLSLGPKKWMVVTRVHGKRLVLGVTDHTITKLAELPPIEVRREVTATASQGKNGQSGVISSAKKMLKKHSGQPVHSVQAGQTGQTTQASSKKNTPETASSDDFEKFYAAAKDHEKTE